MKKASPQTGRVKVTSLHGFIYENAARCPVGRRLITNQYVSNSTQTAVVRMPLSIAIDITSQKYYNEPNSSASCYKRFLKENIWMIVVTGMGSLITEAVKLPFTHKDIKSDYEGYCTLEQIIYHVMRCGLIHGTGEESKIVWNTNVPLAIDKDQNLNISPSFIWGLALCVITCPVNLNERVGDYCWISMATFKYLINDLWGKRDSVKNMIKSQYDVTIKEC